MSRTCVEAEDEFDFDAAYFRELEGEKKAHTFTLVESTTAAAVQASRTANARVVIVFAHTGATAQLFAKYKSKVPVVVVTCHSEVARYCRGLVRLHSVSAIQKVSATAQCPAIRLLARPCSTSQSTLGMVTSTSLEKTRPQWSPKLSSTPLSWVS